MSDDCHGTASTAAIEELLLLYAQIWLEEGRAERGGGLQPGLTHALELIAQRLELRDPDGVVRRRIKAAAQLGSVLRQPDTPEGANGRGADERTADERTA